MVHRRGVGDGPLLNGFEFELLVHPLVLELSAVGPEGHVTPSHREGDGSSVVLSGASQIAGLAGSRGGAGEGSPARTLRMRRP